MISLGNTEGTPSYEGMCKGYPSYGHQCKGEPFAFLNNRNVEYIGNQSFLISRTPNAPNNNVST